MKHSIESALKFEAFMQFNENAKIKMDDEKYLIKRNELFIWALNGWNKVYWTIKDKEFTERLMNICDE